MKRSQEFELRKQCGDLNALCGIKDYTFNDGPARGMRAFDLKNGRGLELTVVADRGLDIPYLSFKGVNIGLLNKAGLRSSHLFQENGATGFLRQFYGGMLTTCGLSYAGGAGEDNGRHLGLHGTYNNIPAGKVCASVQYQSDEKVLVVSGEVRESEVFGDDLLLKRTLTLDTERNELHIRDVVENQAFLTAPLMLIYHINFGYPMLDEGARIYSTATRITARTDFAEEGMPLYDQIEAPEAGREEQCYYHTDYTDGEAFAMLHNEKLGLASIVRYDKNVFPLLCEWKSMRAGDYALGLEPTTSGVVNRSEARANGMLTWLEPGETREFNVTLELSDDAAVIEKYKARAYKA